MAIYIGTSKMKDAYLGTSRVKEIYLGTDKIYSAETYLIKNGVVQSGYSFSGSAKYWNDEFDNNASAPNIVFEEGAIYLSHYSNWTEGQPSTYWSQILSKSAFSSYEKLYMRVKREPALGYYDKGGTVTGICTSVEQTYLQNMMISGLYDNSKTTDQDYVLLSYTLANLPDNFRVLVTILMTGNGAGSQHGLTAKARIKDIWFE